MPKTAHFAVVERGSRYKVPITSGKISRANAVAIAPGTSTPKNSTAVRKKSAGFQLMCTLQG